MVLSLVYFIIHKQPLTQELILMSRNATKDSEAILKWMTALHLAIPCMIQQILSSLCIINIQIYLFANFFS